MRVVYYWSALLLLVLTMASAEEAKTADAAPEENKTKKGGPKFDATDHTDWGTYYDPKSEFCGKFDCYKILGFDYEEFGKQHPDRKEITQRYRSLSREWHPDKSKHKDAKARFVKIARAYEVLTDEETRKEYDFMRYNQEAYMRKYGSDVMWAYAPKTDTLMVIILLLATGSVISWFVQKSHWQKVADKLIKAAAEDWGSNQGGTPESKALRERALKILTDKELEEASANGEVAATDGKKKKKIKLTGTEKRKGQEDSLRPIITELVEEMEDFGAGYHKPTWRDLLIVKAAFFPMSFTMGIIWNAKYMVRRLQKLELSEDEREVLTRRAVGEVNWASCGEEEQKDMITRDLWVSENMIAWEEGQEVKQWNSVDRKRYLRMKKKETKKGGKEE